MKKIFIFFASLFLWNIGFGQDLDFDLVPGTSPEIGKVKDHILPEDFGSQFRTLNSINLENNQLTKLPASFSKLNRTLKYLNLKGNNFSDAEKSKIRRMLMKCKIEF